MQQFAEAVPQDDGSFHIVEHNCAILAVATRYGAACGTELEFIREVLPGARVILDFPGAHPAQIASAAAEATPA